MEDASLALSPGQRRKKALEEAKKRKERQNQGVAQTDRPGSASSHLSRSTRSDSPPEEAPTSSATGPKLPVVKSPRNGAPASSSMGSASSEDRPSSAGSFVGVPSSAEPGEFSSDEEVKGMAASDSDEEPADLWKKPKKAESEEEESGPAKKTEVEEFEVMEEKAPVKAPSPPVSVARKLSEAEEPPPQSTRTFADDGAGKDSKQAREEALGRTAVPAPKATMNCITLPLLPVALDQMREFINRPGPRDILLKCRVKRLSKKRGMSGQAMYAVYLEETNQLVLAARKRTGSKSSNYLVSMDETDLSRKGTGFVSKIRSNFLGTEFVVYDNGDNPEKMNGSGIARKELAVVFYGTNLMGIKGPRKMNVMLPTLDDSGKPERNQPTRQADTLMERYKMCNLESITMLQNKSPEWHEESKSFVLNFHRRVKLPSVKNFQIVHPLRTQSVLMQFGKLTKDEFSLDFKYPFTLLQAFGVAITAFDNKLACE